MNVAWGSGRFLLSCPQTPQAQGFGSVYLEHGLFRSLEFDMPADDTLPQITSRHSNASEPYPCHNWPTPPGTGCTWSIPYGYCRTSLDLELGAFDRRCPESCQHKAPKHVVNDFHEIFITKGAAQAAERSRWYKLQQLKGQYCDDNRLER